MRVRVNPSAEGAIADALEETLTEIGDKTQGNARRTVPIRTGNLSLSIVSQVGRDGDRVVLQVGVDEEILGVDYGGYVERGTSKQAAQPYLVPAILQAGGRVA